MSCGCPRVLLSNPESYAELLAGLTQGASLTTPVSACSVQDLKQMSKHGWRKTKKGDVRDVRCEIPARVYKEMSSALLLVPIT